MPPFGGGDGGAARARWSRTATLPRCSPPSILRDRRRRLWAGAFAADTVTAMLSSFVAPEVSVAISVSVCVAPAATRGRPGAPPCPPCVALRTSCSCLATGSVISRTRTCGLRCRKPLLDLEHHLGGVVDHALGDRRRAEE